VVPSIPQVTTTSILTVGDSFNGYQMVGYPDGLGAFYDGVKGSFELLMNHGLQENGRAGNMPARCRRISVTYAVRARLEQKLITSGYKVGRVASAGPCMPTEMSCDGCPDQTRV